VQQASKYFDAALQVISMNIFRKPYGPSPAEVPATMRNTAPSGPPPSIKGLKVLVVEDDAAARNMIVSTLETFGALVTPAFSVERALDIVFHPEKLKMEKREFDVLISDIGMHGSDGIDLIHKLRAKGLKMPAAALTAYDREEDLTQILDAGFQLCLNKPIEMAYLVSAVADLVQLETRGEVDSEYRRVQVGHRLREYQDL
jgi:CheY-like chemotaxis protein